MIESRRLYSSSSSEEAPPPPPPPPVGEWTWETSASVVPAGTAAKYGRLGSAAINSIWVSLAAVEVRLASVAALFKEHVRALQAAAECHVEGAKNCDTKCVNIGDATKTALGSNHTL